MHFMSMRVSVVALLIFQAVSSNRVDVVNGSASVRRKDEQSNPTPLNDEPTTYCWAFNQSSINESSLLIQVRASGAGRTECGLKLSLDFNLSVDSVASLENVLATVTASKTFTSPNVFNITTYSRNDPTAAMTVDPTTRLPLQVVYVNVQTCFQGQRCDLLAENGRPLVAAFSAISSGGGKLNVMNSTTESYTLENRSLKFKAEGKNTAFAHIVFAADYPQTLQYHFIAYRTIQVRASLSEDSSVSADEAETSSKTGLILAIVASIAIIESIVIAYKVFYPRAAPESDTLKRDDDDEGKHETIDVDGDSSFSSIAEDCLRSSVEEDRIHILRESESPRLSKLSLASQGDRDRVPLTPETQYQLTRVSKTSGICLYQV